MSKYKLDNPYEHLRIPTAKGTIPFRVKMKTKHERKKAEKKIIEEGINEYKNDESIDYSDIL